MVACSVYLYIVTFGANVRICRISRVSSSMMCLAVAGCCLEKNLDQRPMCLQQTSPSGPKSKAGLEVPIDGVTLSDGHCRENAR